MTAIETVAPRDSLSDRSAGRVVGALFLAAFVLYGGGLALVDAASNADDVVADAADHTTQLGIGALLMLANSLVVAAIGVLVLPVLRPHGERVAYGYLAARLAEAVLLAVGAVLVLLLVPIGEEGNTEALAPLARVAEEGNDLAYQAAMVGLGVGSLGFCALLLRARLVARPLAIWGLVGYAVFALGAALEIVGVGVGLVLAIPGGLFELALGVTLLRHGFRPVGDGQNIPYEKGVS
ncbi:MAG: DUF4386 domain-containing protein [Actinomycetota bacterium]|nr:DUF4386 domain-containing protein [Actinomycetota bacterium]